MDLVAQAKQIDKSQLCPYVRQLLEGLMPILAELDPAKVSESSRIEVIQDKRRPLVIRIEPSDNFGQDLYISASEGQFMLGLAGGDYYECHGGAAASMNDSVDEVLSMCSRYLQGVTIVDEYSRRGRRLRTKWYWGIDTENDETRKIATGSSFLGLFFSAHSTRKRTCRFLK
jgi:hypothetical protein